MSKLSKGEQIAGGAAILLVLLSFFPLWAKVEVKGLGALGGAATQRFSGWSGAFGFLWVRLPVLLAIILVVVVLIRASGSNMELPVAPGMLYTGIGALSALLLLIGVLIGTADGGVNIPGLEISRGPALFVGVVLGLAMAAGGYMHMQEEGSAPSPGPVTPPPPAAPPPPAS
jgi:hypothetical protein